MNQNFISFLFPAFSQQPNSINEKKKKIDKSKKKKIRQDSKATWILQAHSSSLSSSIRLHTVLVSHSFSPMFTTTTKSSVQIDYFFLVLRYLGNQKEGLEIGGS